MKERVTRLILTLSLLFVLGMGYAYFGVARGIAIPCPIYTITRFYCPGCGISRMLLSLLSGNFKVAFSYNPFVCLLLPFLLLFLCREMYYYIRGYRGGYRGRMRRLETMFWYGMIFVAVVFGIIRNLPGFSFLAPL